MLKKLIRKVTLLREWYINRPIDVSEEGQLAWSHLPLPLHNDGCGQAEELREIGRVRNPISELRKRHSRIFEMQTRLDVQTVTKNQVYMTGPGTNIVQISKKKVG